MPYTIAVPQLDKGKIALAGGKWANPGELTVAGRPMPAGFVVTTAAYDAFVASPPTAFNRACCSSSMAMPGR